MRIAVLDDYQSVACKMADWDQLNSEVRFIHQPFKDDQDFLAQLHDVEVVVAMRERTRFDARRLSGLPALRLLVTTGRANAAIDLEAARELGITVCNTDSPSAPTVELTWALVLAVLRHLPHETTQLRAGSWQSTIGGDLSGKTLGIVGLGRIGARVAAVGQAFGMRVIAWSQNLAAERAAEHGVTAVSRRDLLQRADVVSVHYKLSERSQGLIGADELSLMKPSSVLINTSRGPLIDTNALIDALARGQLAGAGLDVFDQEPLPQGHPLRTAPNTVLTPHLGYVTQQAYTVFYTQAVEDIRAWQSGSPIRVLV